MKIITEINNKAKNKISRQFVSRIIKNTLLKAWPDIPEKIFSISVAVVEEKEIRKLNKSYRKINSATDVLSFSEYRSNKKLKSTGDKSIFLGELVLCYNDICDWAGKNKLNCQTELARAISHGTLHLLGMRHGKKMFEIQDGIAKNIINITPH